MKRKKLRKLIAKAILYTFCWRNVDKYASLWGYDGYYFELRRREDMETVRPRGTDKAEVMQVIKTISILGRGNKEDPVRYIYQYWDFKGKLLASHDTLEETIE